MKLVSMKLSPKEAKEEAAPAQDANGPAYPYGLCLYLDGEALEKLGLDEDKNAEVGTVVTIAGKALVTGYSERKSASGEAYRSLDLQITDLGVEGGEEKTLAKKVYGDTLTSSGTKDGY